ncbi:hypothetical protein JCM10450v2_005946 [Rhodotorula kratochvilovae]
MAPHAVFVSSDLNVRVQGRIVAHGPPGQIDGTQLELDAEDGLTIRYPQLVSVQTRPDEQTLFSINAGERLLTLATPLLPPENDSVGDSALEDGDADADAAAEKKKPAVVTLHEGFLPASEAPHLESSPLYSSTFQLLIDGPTFPPPHFDPASLAPPTPAVRAHDSPSTSSSLPAGALNSPLQRALLSPLLSPQRRAASQAGSDASVPPLSLGLSRTSRASFSSGDRPSAPSAPHHARGLAALLTAPGAPVPTLTGTLTGALSTAAKRTAEELVALRRAHDAYVRRAKAEMEILDARVEHFDGLVVAGKEEGVVRGFKTRDEREERVRRSVDAGGSVSRSRERGAARVKEEEARAESQSRSRERGPSQGRRGSEERAARPGWCATGDASSNGGGTGAGSTKGTLKDEDVSSLIRAQDEREDDERGRSRSRARRGEAALGSTAGQRSRSRTKAVAEATAKALEGTPTRSADSRSRERAAAAAEGERRGRAHRKGENIPATLEEEEEEEEDEQGAVRVTDEANGRDGLLSPSSAGAGQPTRAGGSTGSTPNLAHGHPLVAIPESDESAPPSEAGAEVKTADEQLPREREISADGLTPTDDQPFEMDEDVDVDRLDLASPSEPLESPSLEVDGTTPPLQQQQSGISSSFRPGSFQRASALSASYNALLATASPGARASPRSPAAGVPLSPSVTATRAYGSPATRAASVAGQASTLPPFSPPEAHRQTASSARENAQTALAAATFEHARLSGGARSGPDPRDVRRGEQKIRDVLAMDVPSHRPMYSTRRRASVGMAPSAATYQADDDADSTTSEDDDEVGTLAASAAAELSATAPSGGAGGKFQVGSLPIALGRPSAVNAALSSWRPDPERLWAQQRERKTSLAQGREAPFVPPLKTHGSGSFTSASHPHAVPTAGGGAALLPLEPPSVPRGIDSPATPRPGGAGGTGISGLPGSAAPAASSSLAQSLRNTPASFGRRAELDVANGQRPSADQVARERGAEVKEDGMEGSEEEESEDEDGAFVPPHLVAERRERKDERWLSRSIGSKR